MSSLLRFVPAGLAHALAPVGLLCYSSLFDRSEDPLLKWKEFSWRGLFFRNRLGIAGGVDKNAELLSVWEKLGAGFVEVGTVTPLPQKSNPGKILERDWHHKNLWNRMGFPSLGAREVYWNLFYSDTSLPKFVNIGKNRETPNEKAVDDYLQAAKALQSVGDVFVINVSSPNTKGLRDLQAKEQLRQLVTAVTNCLSPKPVLVKLSPDLTDEQLQDSLLASVNAGAAGFVLTNTTLARPPGCPFPSEGGLSGADLKAKSLATLRNAAQILGKYRQGLLIVSAGGVLTPQDVEQRLSLGADLVQTYSGLVFQGPGFFWQTARYFHGGHL